MSGTIVDQPTIERMAAVGGVTAAVIIAALRRSEVWEVVAGGPLGNIDSRLLSAEAKAELHSQLGEIHTGLMAKVKEGDLAASALAAKIAVQRAMLR